MFKLIVLLLCLPVFFSLSAVECPPEKTIYEADHSNFSVFEYLNLDLTCCGPSNYVQRALITRTDAGVYSLEMNIIIEGQREIDECYDYRCITNDTACLVVQDMGERLLNEDEVDLILNVFKDIKYEVSEPCSDCLVQQYTWDDVSYFDYELMCEWGHGIPNILEQETIDNIGLLIKTLRSNY